LAIRHTDDVDSVLPISVLWSLSFLSVGADDRSDDSHRALLSSGKVFQLDFLFRLEVRRQRFNLSEFDRIRLSRGFRAGYQVSLVARTRN
jgi:hypothetical protein